MWLKFTSGQPLSSAKDQLSPKLLSSAGNGPLGASSLRYRHSTPVDCLFLLIKEKT